jgi:peptidoglycan/LPS O-acetylase OafA/YrhL
VDADVPQRAGVGGLTDRFFRPGLTGIRALAASWVMLFHLNAIYGPAWLGLGVGNFMVDVTPLVTIGWVGVNLFFVLSGFLLTTHLLEEYDPANAGRVLRRYARARFLRVFPAYWAQIAILLAIAWIANGAAPPWARYLPLHFFMAHNLTVESSFAINAVYWTLPIELGFYFCLPLIFRRLVARGMEPAVLFPRMLIFLAAILVVTLGYRIAAFQAYRNEPVNSIVWAINQIPGTLDQFTFGMLVAVVFRFVRTDPAWATRLSGEAVSTFLFIAGMSGTVAMMYWIHHTPDYWSGSRLVYVWYTITCVFLAIAVFSIATSSRLTRALFENRAMVFLGTVSYSIYLWHYPVSRLVAEHMDKAAAGRVGFGLAAFAATVAVSAASYYAVERPFMRWGSRRKAS